MSYRRFFEKLTGFSPHPYQERFAEELLRGRSVILRVPTGAGKTWAAVAPFLYALADSHRLSDRLLYALPLRSLASSLFASVHEKMGGFFLANVAPDLGSARFPFEKGTEMGKIGGMKSFCAAGVTISGIELTGSSRLANWVAATPRCQRFGELRWLRNSR